MGVVKRLFRTLEESRKRQVVFFCASMVILCLCYFVSIKMLDRKFELIEDDYTWAYQVDSIIENNGKLKITGWAFLTKQNAAQKEFEILLRDVQTEKIFYPKMKYNCREDVNQYFLCEYDYSQSGFEAIFSVDKLDMDNGVYEVILKPRAKRSAYLTEIYYADRQMMFTNPTTFKSLNVIGTDLEKIVEEGILRVYRPDYGVYVYQYEDELYYIANSEYAFSESGKTYIECGISTTQVSKLPQERLDMGANTGNEAFFFEEYEIQDQLLEQYRVAKKSLPNQYAIQEMWTGAYSDGWIWIQYFRPWYKFE